MHADMLQAIAQNADVLLYYIEYIRAPSNHFACSGKTQTSFWYLTTSSCNLARPAKVIRAHNIRCDDPDCAIGVLLAYRLPSSITFTFT